MWKKYKKTVQKLLSFLKNYASICSSHESRWISALDLLNRGFRLEQQQKLVRLGVDVLLSHSDVRNAFDGDS